jgi:DNA-directed RNA polymerase subunit RPC12/RpoP
MFQQTTTIMNSILVCPECKNNVDLSRYPGLAAGTVVECNHCGMTLAVKEVGAEVKAEIVDEGK